MNGFDRDLHMQTLFNNRTKHNQFKLTVRAVARKSWWNEC